jgi:sulfate permease, SulP family
MRGVLPIQRSRVPADVLAGFTLAALGIPEVLGYAKIAGMPVVTGLYTMLLPMAVFAVLGSSRHLVVAADSATAAILAAALTGLAVAGSQRYVHLAGLAALLASAMLLVGFLTGVGIQVAAGQLPDMLGVTAAGRQTPARFWDTVRAFPDAHGADVAVSVGVIVIVLAARRITRQIPGPLIAVIIAIVVSWAADLASHGVAVVGPVPRGLPSLGLPALGWHDAAGLVGAAASMFVVILAQSAATRAPTPSSTRRSSAKTPTWSAWAPPTLLPRSPARSSSTAARPKRRWSTARAAAASWPSSPPPAWS